MLTNRKIRHEQYKKMYEEKEYIKINWHAVSIDLYWDEIGEWLEKNCTGQWKLGRLPASVRPVLYFELEQDAMMFILRWT